LGLKEVTVELLKEYEAAMAARDPAALSRLLLDDSHEYHEDIVFELGLIRDPCAVDAIARAVQIPFDHLVKWNNLHEFQRKCAYALANIGTPESRSALEVLAQQADPFLQEYGQEGLEHWALSSSRGRT
jgi:hypothetical protein